MEVALLGLESIVQLLWAGSDWRNTISLPIVLSWLWEAVRARVWQLRVDGMFWGVCPWSWPWPEPTEHRMNRNYGERLVVLLEEGIQDSIKWTVCHMGAGVHQLLSPPNLAVTSCSRLWALPCPLDSFHEPANQQFCVLSNYPSNHTEVRNAHPFHHSPHFWDAVPRNNSSIWCCRRSGLISTNWTSSLSGLNSH